MGLQADFSSFGGEESLIIPFFYLAIILVFTAVILFVTRKRKGGFIKYAFLGVICLSLMYVFYALFNFILYPPPEQRWSAKVTIDGGVNTILIANLVGDSESEIIIGSGSGRIAVFDTDFETLWTTGQPLDEPVTDLAVANLDDDSQTELIVLAGRAHIFDTINQNNELNLTYSTSNDYYISLVVVPDYPRASENRTKPVVIVGSSSNNGIGNNTGTIEMLYHSNNTYNTITLLSLDSPVNTLAYGFFDDPLNREIFLGTTDGIYTIGSPKSGSAIPSPELVVSNDSPILGIRIINIDRESKSELVAYDEDGRILIYKPDKLKPAWKTDLGDNIRDVEFGNIYSDSNDLINKEGNLIDEGYEMVVSVDGKGYIYYSTDNKLLNERLEFTAETGRVNPAGAGLDIGNIDDNSDPDILLGHRNGFNQYQYIWPVYSDIPCFLGLAVAIFITMALYYYPEWYLVDIVGILVAGGVAALIGISIGLLPILILLIILAIYDAISVYKTKHMVSLADKVMEFKLPILLVVPKRRGYSFLRQKGLKKQLDEGEEREAMFIGLGDIIIPGALVISAFHFLPAEPGMLGISANLLVAIFTLVGTLVGFSVLMQYVLKGNPQAGLPLLNTGAILGFFISNYLIYQDLTFGLTLPFG
jgi:presenilin-like A22 family membrane protease